MLMTQPSMVSTDTITSIFEPHGNKFSERLTIHEFPYSPLEQHKLFNNQE